MILSLTYQLTHHLTDGFSNELNQGKISSQANKYPVEIKNITKSISVVSGGKSGNTPPLLQIKYVMIQSYKCIIR